MIHGDAAPPGARVHAVADRGSFRDPLSRVFRLDGADGPTIVRGLSAEALDDYRALAATHFYPAALARGEIVGTSECDPAAAGLPPAVDGQPWAGALRHDAIGVLSYPYEWTFEMLRDAARLQLRLSRAALDERILTKDASSYNVQFVGATPVFIDVGSFERLRPGEPWAGYRQFCELFLNPLYVQSIAGIPFQPLLRANVAGIDPTLTRSLLGGRGRFTKGVLANVTLHARADKRYADADTTRDLKAEMQRAGFGPGIIRAQLQNLGKVLDALEWDQQHSVWSDYSDRAHYTDVDLETKERFVADAVRAHPDPRLVLDLGANDGRFSHVAVDAGAAAAVAADFDALVIDRLYRRLRDRGERRILPLVLDLANPSPAIGWRNAERPAFVDRVRPDVTLCLAVVHHLALTNNVPLDEVVAMLADFADAKRGTSLVVEFPHPDDVMARRLLARKRAGLFDHYSVESFEQALAARFDTVERVELPSGTRTLYRCTPR